MSFLSCISQLPRGKGEDSHYSFNQGIGVFSFKIKGLAKKTAAALTTALLQLTIWCLLLMDVWHTSPFLIALIQVPRIFQIAFLILDIF
jgi:hypothetical protein